jgi:glycosyltransferase involved in cell wall biosynthesis
LALRIGINTLFLDGSQQSSLANFVVAFVAAMVEHVPQHRLVVFASPSTAKFFDRLPTASIDLVHCPVSNETRWARILYEQVRLPTVIARYRVDVLCCLADVSPLRVKVPVVLKVNTLHHYTAPAALGLLRRLYRRLMIGASARRARLVVANSKPTASDIHTLLGIPDDRIRLVYEAVDDCFVPYADQFELDRILKTRFGITDKYLLFVSALYKYKRLNELIRAFELLVATDRWHGDLVIAGPDPHKTQRESEQLAESLSIGHRVRFLGPVDNEHLRELYCGASAFVYPSASETFGKPIVEAMRCGTPIVAADRGSIPDIAAGAALLVDPDNIEGMANAIDKLLTDSRLRSDLREIGLRRGRDFSWRNVALGFSGVLEEAMA